MGIPRGDKEDIPIHKGENIIRRNKKMETRCKYCGSKKGSEAVNYLIGNQTATEYRCLICNMVVKREYDKYNNSSKGWRSIKDILRANNN